jgi:hypothetical protein
VVKNFGCPAPSGGWRTSATDFFGTSDRGASLCPAPRGAFGNIFFMHGVWGRGYLWVPLKVFAPAPGGGWRSSAMNFLDFLLLQVHFAELDPVFCDPPVQPRRTDG